MLRDFSSKIDVALYAMCQANRRNRQCQLWVQPLAPLQPMFRNGLTPLSGDAELFEQLGCQW
jgi:hypothetical protein